MIEFVKSDRLVLTRTHFLQKTFLLCLVIVSPLVLAEDKQEPADEGVKSDLSQPAQHKRDKCKLQGYRPPLNKPPYNREAYNRCLKMHQYFRDAEKE